MLAACGALAACGREPADLSTEQLTQVVDAQRPTLKVCYDAELERLPTARELRLDSEIHIAPSGRVSSVEIEQGEASAGLVSCLRATIARWQFPRAKEPTHTSLPLVFKPEVVPSGPNLDDVQEILKQLKAKPVQPPQAPGQPAPPAQAPHAPAQPGQQPL